MSAEALIASLYHWQSPDEMSARVDALGDLLGNDAMQHNVRLLQETNDGVTPDVEVRRGDHCNRYETTEADVPGRRRQLEYRDPTPPGVEPMIFTSLNVMVPHIQALVRKKASKPYRDCTGLVLHLNPPAFSFEPSFRATQMREATEPAAAAFNEVWVMRDQGVLLWKNGSFVGQLHDDF
jgi:hypothetical protein